MADNGLMKERSRQLRSRQSDAESRLWYHLRNRQLEGWKFRRQHVVGPFIVDFVCLERSLVVEADGGQHGENREKDEQRSKFLTGRGLRVLRFWNHEILDNTQSVLSVILRELNAAKAP
jgi:very-short-patch-repair endonuclease